MIYCKKCGQEISENSSYCNKCGCDLRDNSIIGNSLNEYKEKQNIRIPRFIWISVVIIVIILSCIWYGYHLNATLNEAQKLYASEKYIEAKDKLDGLVFLGGNDKAEKIRMVGHIGWNYENYHDEIKLNEWSTPDYTIAVELLFDGLETCKISEMAEKTDWKKSIIYTIKEKYYSELNSYFGISKSDAEQILKLEGNEKERKIVEIANNMKSKKDALENNRKNPFDFENTSLTSSGDYVYYRGSIKNKSDLTYQFVQVRATYYDSSKNVITTDTTYVVGSEGIRPNESKQFEVMTKVIGEVSTGDIEIYNYTS